MTRFKVSWGSFMRTPPYRKHLQMIPFLFTFANALWGLFAIIKALEGEYATAVYCIMLAALMDACDGRCARALGVSSILGAELDSLADAISFCAAPAILVYAWYPGAIGITGWIAISAYLCAGIYRLARFNITTHHNDYSFSGLPVPMAAFFVSSIVLYYHWISTHALWFVVYKRVPFVLIATVAALMVSHIPFPSFKKPAKSHHLWKRMAGALAAWMLAMILFMHGYPLLFFGIIIYIIGSIILHVWHTYTHRSKRL